jgi:predicted RNA-binding protein with PUA-like domain
LPGAESSDDDRFVVAAVKPVRRFGRLVALAEIKADPKLTGFALVRFSRLSVLPLTDEQWAEIERMSSEVA